MRVLNASETHGRETRVVTLSNLILMDGQELALILEGRVSLVEGLLDNAGTEGTPVRLARNSLLTNVPLLAPGCSCWAR
jgi:hypothetical protein